ncbi:hypothetical protein [uncultured Helicobacter sp.]|uniref:hypothetical protein n=1 Tax=uncultured Helicobacter sp. TaxID=175537 RepID=UPI0026276778|nr:hypothetical protein [uncultured Helicobacter sp.]
MNLEAGLRIYLSLSLIYRSLDYPLTPPPLFFLRHFKRFCKCGLQPQAHTRAEGLSPVRVNAAIYHNDKGICGIESKVGVKYDE